MNIFFRFFWAYIYDMSGNKDKRWIYILTNKRIIAICCDEYGMAEVDYTKLKNIIFVPDKTEIFFNIEGWYRGFSDVRAEKENLEFTQHEIEKIMPYIREIQEKEAQKKKFFGSPAEEIRKFKELYDDGIITKEEFEDRKRELLKFKYVD